MLKKSNVGLTFKTIWYRVKDGQREQRYKTQSPETGQCTWLNFTWEKCGTINQHGKDVLCNQC